MSDESARILAAAIRYFARAYFYAHAGLANPLAKKWLREEIPDEPS